MQRGSSKNQLNHYRVIVQQLMGLQLRLHAGQRFTAMGRGFTIIESLVAIVVITILLSTIAPMLALSVATRVQARRIEQATLAARAYIDRVTNNPAPYAGLGVNPTNAGFGPAFGASTVVPSSNVLQLRLVAPPNSPDNSTFTAGATLNCPTSNTYCIDPPSLYCVSLDTTPGCQVNSNRDLLINAVRTTTAVTHSGGFTSTPDDGRGYRMNVRVYRAAAFRNGLRAPQFAQVGQGRTQATFTGGLGNSGFPLVEIPADISTVSGTAGAPQINDLCRRFQATGASNPYSANCQ